MTKRHTDALLKSDCSMYGNNAYMLRWCVNTKEGKQTHLPWRTTPWCIPLCRNVAFSVGTSLCLNTQRLLVLGAVTFNCRKESQDRWPLTHY